MVQFRPHARELIAKIVYYGPPLGGKTTNLHTLYEGYPKDIRGELAVVPAGADRTIYFDFLPLEAGTLRNLKLRVQLYTVPGQVEYNSTRQLVLRGVDGVVFVADSQRSGLSANLESWLNLKDNLAMQGLNPSNVPLVIQYNKRDLPEILDVESLDEFLNEFNSPFFEAVATTGIGVQETLQAAVKLVVRSLRDRFQVAQESQPIIAPDQTTDISVALPPADVSSPVVVPFSSADSRDREPARVSPPTPPPSGLTDSQAGVTRPVSVPGPRPRVESAPERPEANDAGPAAAFSDVQQAEPFGEGESPRPAETEVLGEESVRDTGSPSPFPDAAPGVGDQQPPAAGERDAGVSADGPFHADAGPFPEAPPPGGPAGRDPELKAAPARPHRDPGEITLPSQDIEEFMRERTSFSRPSSGGLLERPLVTAEPQEPEKPELDERTLVRDELSQRAQAPAPEGPEWREHTLPGSMLETLPGIELPGVDQPGGEPSGRDAPADPSVDADGSRPEDGFALGEVPPEAESTDRAREAEPVFPPAEAVPAPPFDAAEDPFGPAAPLESEGAFPLPEPEDVPEEVGEFETPEPAAAEVADDEMTWLPASEQLPVPPTVEARQLDPFGTGLVGDRADLPSAAWVDDENTPVEPVAIEQEPFSQPLAEEETAPFSQEEEDLPAASPEDSWAEDVVFGQDPVPAEAVDSASTEDVSVEPHLVTVGLDRDQAQEQVLSIPASALQRVAPRVLAQYGDVRELEIEVPVPALWTGGKRITLQLRMTLVPQEEDDGGSDHHS